MIGGDKKDPAFLWSATAWLQSETVRAMSLEARGAYADLLSLAWLDGFIPGCHDQIRALLHLSEAQFGRIWPMMAECWERCQDGRLVSPSLERERERIRIGSGDRLRQHVLQRDGYRCRYCGSATERLHLDHVFPRSRGGTDSPDNLVAACAPCNISKGARTPEEWGGRRQ